MSECAHKLLLKPTVANRVRHLLTVRPLDETATGRGELRGAEMEDTRRKSRKRSASALHHRQSSRIVDSYAELLLASLSWV